MIELDISSENYNMGCGGSKGDIAVSAEAKKEDKVKVNLARDDEEFEVLAQGKTITKSKLDEITENNSNTSRINEKPKIDPKMDDKNNHSIKISETEKPQDDKPDSKEQDSQLNKSVTVKIEFDKHPHEFDFSFIEEKPKTVHEQDLLTDQILKEISSVN